MSFLKKDVFPYVHEVEGFARSHHLWDEFGRRYNFVWKKYNSSRVNRMQAWLGIYHYDGFIREKALLWLTEHYSDHKDLNRILHKLLDWVAAVRAAADEWLVMNAGTIFTAGDLAANAEVLPRIKRSTRVKQLKSMPVIDNLIINSIETDRAVLTKTEFSFRRYIIGLLLNQDNYKELLISHYQSEPDPTIRYAIYQSLTEEDFYKFSELFVGDRSAMIKSKAIYRIISDNNAGTENMLKKALVDQSRTVRQIGQYYISNRYQFDYQSYYRGLVDIKLKTVCLSDNPELIDYELFLMGVKNTYPNRIRLASLKAIIELKMQGEIRSLILKLYNENGKFRRLLTRVISSDFTLDEVVDAYPQLSQSGENPLAYLNAISEKSRLRALAVALQMYSTNPKVQGVFKDFAKLHFIKNRNAPRPVDSNTGSNMARNWEKIKKSLNDHVLTGEIDFILREYTV